MQGARKTFELFQFKAVRLLPPTLISGAKKRSLRHPLIRASTRDVESNWVNNGEHVHCLNITKSMLFCSRNLLQYCKTSMTLQYIAAFALLFSSWSKEVYLDKHNSITLQWPISQSPMIDLHCVSILIAKQSVLSLRWSLVQKWSGYQSQTVHETL